MSKSFGKEENVSTLIHDVTIRKEEPEDQIFVKKEFDEEGNEIIQESPDISNDLQILKKYFIEEIEMKKEPVQCEDTKEDIKKVKLKEEVMKNEPDENEYSYKEIILKALDTVITIPKSFACGGILPKIKMQLSVKGVGNINLPLSLKQADVLKTKCTAAPYGRGAQTLVNKSVRDAWQVDAEDVTLNEEFKILIKDKMAEIIPQLMGESLTEALRQSVIESNKIELYKLVLYKKGGHFVAHRDTEKAPGMFVTLVIQLPAEHRGGALVIKHKGYTEVFNHENNSRTNFFFTAFFADCEHELRKITDGHRLVLIYNIIRNNPYSTIHTDNDISFSKNEMFLTTMKKAVNKWKSVNNGPNYLAMELDFLYTDANISFQNLKGKDKKISDALCSYADFEVYLATITKIETRRGYASEPKEYDSDESEDDSMSDKESEDDSMSDKESEDDPMDEELTESYYTLTDWIGVNNDMKNYGEKKLDANEMLIDEEDMFQENYDLDESEIEYTGNEGCSQEYIYKKTAIVIFPRSFAFLLACKEDFTSVIVECKNISDQGKVWEMLCEIMDYIKRHDKSKMQLKENNNIASIFDLLSSFENKIESANFFLKALINIGLPTEKSGVALANLINKLSWESLGANVIELVKMHATTNTQSFAQLVKSMQDLGLQEQALNVVEVATSHIIVRKGTMSCDILGHWLSLLASYGNLSSQYYEYFQQILDMNGNIMIEIIVEMHRSLQPEVMGQNKIIQCFQNVIKNLQDKGWKNFSPKLVTLVIPVLVFVDKNESLKSLVQVIIQLENSNKFLEPILKLPIVLSEKYNPSVQLMVQTRLQQLEEIQQPVFSWAQSDATVENIFTYYRRPLTGPLTKDIQDFLRSDVKSNTFGCFDNIKHARCFGRTYFPNGNYNEPGHYSATHNTSGRGKDAKCTVSKTRNFFDEQMRRYNNLYTEAKFLRKNYCNLKKTVAMKRALE